MAKILASASKHWPRPRSFGLGLDVLASFNITALNSKNFQTFPGSLAALQHLTTETGHAGLTSKMVYPHTNTFRLEKRIALQRTLFLRINKKLIVT